MFKGVEGRFRRGPIADDGLGCGDWSRSKQARAPHIYALYAPAPSIQEELCATGTAAAVCLHKLQWVRCAGASSAHSLSSPHNPRLLAYYPHQVQLTNNSIQ